MKLTDEMIAAIQRTYPQYAFTVADGRAQIEEMFLAGYRMGERDMRERATRVVTKIDNIPASDVALVWIREAIRSLPIEDEA